MLRPSVKVELSLTIADGLTEGRGIADGSPLSALGPLTTTLRPVFSSAEANRPVTSINAKLRHRDCWFGDGADENWENIMMPWLQDATQRLGDAIERIDPVRTQFDLTPLSEGVVEWRIEPLTMVVEGNQDARTVATFIEELHQQLTAGALAEDGERISRVSFIPAQEDATTEEPFSPSEDSVRADGDDALEEKPAAVPDEDGITEKEPTPISDAVIPDQPMSEEEEPEAEAVEELPSERWIIEYRDGTVRTWDRATEAFVETTFEQEAIADIDNDATEAAQKQQRVHALSVEPLRYGSVFVPAWIASPSVVEEEGSPHEADRAEDGDQLSEDDQKSQIAEKLAALDEWLTDHPGVTIGFSGGPASFVLAHHARKVLADNATIIFADHELLPQERRDLAEQLRQELSTTFIDHPGLCSRETHIGSADCCYSCRYHLYEALIEAAGMPEKAAIGEAVDILHGLGRGHQALRELGVRTPLADVGLTQAELMEAARDLGFSDTTNADVPCVIERLPFGKLVDDQETATLSAVEARLRQRHGIPSLRVLVSRDGTARIDVDSSWLHRYLGVEEDKRIDYPELTRLAREWPHVRDIVLEGAVEPAPGTVPLGEVLSDIYQSVRDTGYVEAYFEDAIAQRVREVGEA